MNIFNLFNSRVSKYSAERRAINELRALSDRDLNDMGLSRGMIPHAVRNGLSRR